MSLWYLRHPQGYWTGVGFETLPMDLAATSVGAVGISVSDEDGSVDELREWTGKKWKLLTGREREQTLDWMRG